MKCAVTFMFVFFALYEAAPTYMNWIKSNEKFAFNFEMCFVDMYDVYAYECMYLFVFGYN